MIDPDSVYYNLRWEAMAYEGVRMLGLSHTNAYPEGTPQLDDPHRTDEPTANHALTFNLDHPSGAAQTLVSKFIVIDRLSMIACDVIIRRFLCIRNS